MGNFERRRRLDGIREGDRINVFSGGNKINGKGFFIRKEYGLFIWVHATTNINVASLDVISI
ncbi:hypothetical protein [Bacillus tropicus]|uniref:hypothetical protein n=1 Tax=Bacillus tropicus TaxID=2026188 RepID=UPI0038279E52